MIKNILFAAVLGVGLMVAGAASAADVRPPLRSPLEIAKPSSPPFNPSPIPQNPNSKKPHKWSPHHACPTCRPHWGPIHRPMPHSPSRRWR